MRFLHIFIPISAVFAAAAPIPVPDLYHDADMSALYRRRATMQIKYESSLHSMAHGEIFTCERHIRGYAPAGIYTKAVVKKCVPSYVSVRFSNDQGLSKDTYFRVSGLGGPAAPAA